MEWWQIALIALLFLATIPIGVLAASLFYYLTLRLVYKRKVAFFSILSLLFAKTSKTPPGIEEQAAKEPLAKEPLFRTQVVEEEALQPQVVKEPAFKHQAVEEYVVQERAAKEEAEFTVPELTAEVRHNYKIAAQALGDNLLPLETSVWDAHQYEVYNLPQKVRDDLYQIYRDIRLANSLVWLSTELGRRTPDLTEKYVNLCTKIAQGLEKIDQIVEPDFAE